MVTKEEFREECEKWLEEYGYSLSSTTSDASDKAISFSFFNSKKYKYPNIICRLIDGEKSMELSFYTTKGFITVSTGDIMFKHPRFEWYLDLMEEYKIILNS